MTHSEMLRRLDELSEKIYLLLYEPEEIEWLISTIKDLIAREQTLRAAIKTPMKYWKSCGYDKTSNDPSASENVDPEFFIYRVFMKILEETSEEK